MNSLLVGDLHYLSSGVGGGGGDYWGVAWFSGRMEEDQSSLI